MIDHLRSLVDDLVGVPVDVDRAAARDRAIQAAVARYSADRPRRTAADLVTADGSTLALPAGPVFVRPSAVTHLGVSVLWGVDTTPDGLVVRLAPTISSGAPLRLVYETGYRWDAVDGEDGPGGTIPEADRGAVAALAAAHVLQGMAAAHAGDVQPTLGAVALPGAAQTASGAFAARAKDLQARYAAEIAVDRERGPAAASAVAVQPIGGPATPRLFQRRRV